jgi:hypothetical protein
LVPNVQAFKEYKDVFSVQMPRPLCFAKTQTVVEKTFADSLCSISSRKGISHKGTHWKPANDEVAGLLRGTRPGKKLGLCQLVVVHG